MRGADRKRQTSARASLRQRWAHRHGRRQLQRERKRAAAPVRRAGWALGELWWAVQVHVLWALSDWIVTLRESLGWRLEDAGWAIRRRLVWPLGDAWAAFSSRAGALFGVGTAGPGSARVPAWGTATALCALAVVAATAGALTAKPGDDRGSSSGATSAPVALGGERPERVAAHTEPKPQGPTLMGARPSFNSSPGEQVAAAIRKIRERRERQKEAGEAETASEAEKTEGAEETGEESAAAETYAAGLETAAAGSEGSEPDASGEELDEQPGAVRLSAARRNPVSRARRTARRFAGAFLAYEVGSGTEETDDVLRRTSTPRLYRDLEERPPRQPLSGGVPRAHIVNVVAGPRERGEMTVSVSLLRARGLSELRLDLRRRSNGGWIVSAVKG